MSFSTIFQYFFWVCLFPTTSKFHKWPSKLPKLTKILKLYPNHAKSRNRQTIEKTFRHCKIIHIRVVLIYSELTSHAKSQRYIRFDIDTPNNFFWLKSQIFLNFKKFFVKKWNCTVLVQKCAKFVIILFNQYLLYLYVTTPTFQEYSLVCEYEHSIYTLWLI